MLWQYFRTAEAFAALSDVKTDWELARRVSGVQLRQVHKQHDQTSRRACGIETSALMTEQVTETHRYLHQRSLGCGTKPHLAAALRWPVRAKNHVKLPQEPSRRQRRRDALHALMPPTRFRDFSFLWQLGRILFGLPGSFESAPFDGWSVVGSPPTARSTIATCRRSH